MKLIFVPQQAQIQKGEQYSASSWCDEWSVCENKILSIPVSVQSSISPQGRNESVSTYKANMTENIFMK